MKITIEGIRDRNEPLVFDHADGLVLAVATGGEDGKYESYIDGTAGTVITLGGVALFGLNHKLGMRAVMRAVKEALAAIEGGVKGKETPVADSEPASVPPEPPTLSASDTAQMVRMLGLERDEMRNGWWLPAEPGPVFCTSIPHAVAEWQRLFENDHERAVAALRAEVAALRAKCDALDDALADETGRARSEETDRNG